MAKRKDTVAIEQLLIDDTHQKRIYGCEEVTIGFWRSGGGDEHVDFMTMDSKDIFKCYEIKVTLSDLKSHAKKSFYGHYNYLVVTRSLYKIIKDTDIDLEKYGIPNWVGIIVADVDEDGKYTSRFYVLQSARNAKKQNISDEQLAMLKSSLIRTMYYKMVKYRHESDGSTVKTAKKEASEYKKKYNYEYQRNKNASNAIYYMIHMFYIKYNYRLRVSLDSDAADWFVEIESLIKYILHMNSKKNRRYNNEHKK